MTLVAETRHLYWILGYNSGGRDKDAGLGIGGIVLVAEIGLLY